MKLITGDGIKRHPFLQQLEANDEDAFMQRPPAFVRIGTIIVAMALLCSLGFAEFFEVHTSVPIALATEKSLQSAFRGTTGAPSVLEDHSLQASGYLSQIGNVRVGQVVHLKERLCLGRLCSGRMGVIVSIAPESHAGEGYLVRAQFQRVSEASAVPRSSQENGNKVYGRILTRDFFLPEPLFTMGEWLFGNNLEKSRCETCNRANIASVEQ